MTRSLATAITWLAAVVLPCTAMPRHAGLVIRRCALVPHLPTTATAMMTAPGGGRDDETMAVEEIVDTVLANINEGQLSTRGEGWFVGQVSLVLGILFAPPEPVAPLVETVCGTTFILLGIALGSAAVHDLGWNNLTPWPKPVKGNALQTEGVYSLCRHPMYTCILAAAFGLSLITLSFERLLLTVALFALLSLKAGREEAFLNDTHGERYRAYAAYVPQFFPTVGAVKAFAADTFAGRAS